MQIPTLGMQPPTPTAQSLPGPGWWQISEGLQQNLGRDTASVPGRPLPIPGKLERSSCRGGVSPQLKNSVSGWRNRSFDSRLYVLLQELLLSFFRHFGHTQITYQHLIFRKMCEQESSTKIQCRPWKVLATDKLKPQEAVDLGTEYSSKDKASRPGGGGGGARRSRRAAHPRALRQDSLELVPHPGHQPSARGETMNSSCFGHSISPVRANLGRRIRRWSD